MKKSFLVLLLLLLGLSKSFGQEAPVEAEGPVRLIRSGLNFYHQGPHAEAGMIADRAFSLLIPAYTQLGRKLYVSYPLPSINFSSRGDVKSGYIYLQPSVGYVFLKPTSRVRPFLAGVLGFEAQYQRIPDYYFSPNSPRYTQWRTRTTLELRLGAYCRITDRFWLDLTLDAPTGHSLYYIGTSSGENALQEVFNNSYDTFLPKVQLGVSYQIR